MNNPHFTEKTLPGLHQSLINSLPQLDYHTPILDVGCGSGAWLERLAAHGFRCLHGVDRDAAQFHGRDAKFTSLDLDYEDWLLGNERFGLITAIEVIEHLENLGRFFLNASQNLCDQGYLLLTTPNIHSIDCRMKFFLTGNMKSFDAKGDPTHVTPILIKSLRVILSRHSLRIIRKWGYPERGSLITRTETQILSRIFDLVLPNPDPGDTLCLLIQRV